MKKIVIIGGGASGLACASTLNEMKINYGLDLEITLLEANDKLGKKILASGNGRCNLSNTNIHTNDYHHFSSFDLEPILSSYDYKEFFDQKGLWTKEEGELVYPNSKQATSVVNLLSKQLNGVQICLKTKAKHIDTVSQMVICENQSFPYDHVVLATGSKASKSLGGNDSGYMMLKELHHTITPLQPALVQLKSSQVKKYLKGTRLRGTFSLIRNKQIIHQEKGELLFTDYGLSGISIFQLSRYYQEGDLVEVDVFDEYSDRELSHRLKNALSKDVLDLELILPNAFGKFLKEKYSSISFNDISRIVNDLKHYRFKIDGLYDFEHAQITKGGLSLNEVNQDLTSQLDSHLSICGELLDVDGPCGGYNLHFAFSSGTYVAKQIMNKMLGGEL